MGKHHRELIRHTCPDIDKLLFIIQSLDIIYFGIFNGLEKQ